MRIMTCFFIIMTGLALNAYPESLRETTADRYMESYAAQMRRQTGSSAAEVRAENYRHLYEKCDEHHHCTNKTAGEEARPKQSRKIDSRPETVKPFIHVFMWQ